MLGALCECTLARLHALRCAPMPRCRAHTTLQLSEPTLQAALVARGDAASNPGLLKAVNLCDKFLCSGSSPAAPRAVSDLQGAVKKALMPSSKASAGGQKQRDGACEGVEALRRSSGEDAMSCSHSSKVRGMTCMHGFSRALLMLTAWPTNQPKTPPRALITAVL